MHMLVNVLAFKVGWMSSVYGAANDLPTLGPFVVLIAILLHLYFAQDPSRELILVLSAGLVGAAFDSILVTAGWLTYSSGMIGNNIAPYWMIGMWMLFATTLNMAMRWFHSKLPVAAVAGLILGPFSYFVGSKIGAVTFANPLYATIALAIGWAAIMPALLMLARRFDGINVQAEQSRI